MNFNSLEDKCLYYRGLTDYKILPNSNILVMLDGKNFSKLIKNSFKKPFDDDFIDMMNKTAKYLCNNVQGVKLAYVQSDEISLLITDYDTPETDTPFAGRLCKLQSILASIATSEFNKWFIIHNLNNQKSNVDAKNFISEMKMAQFDCKVWVVPSQNDAYAWFLYRQNDCIRNSKQQTAQTYLSHKELVGKKCDQQIELLKQKNNIDWNNFDNQYKYGRFVYRIETEIPFDGNVDTFYYRNRFTVVPAFPLNDLDNKNKFLDICFYYVNNDIKW